MSTLQCSTLWVDSLPCLYILKSYEQNKQGDTLAYFARASETKKNVFVTLPSFAAVKACRRLHLIIASAINNHKKTAGSQISSQTCWLLRHYISGARNIPLWVGLAMLLMLTAWPWRTLQER
jgi:hypothetical protein